MNDWQNLLIHGDCLNAAKYLKEEIGNAIRLIYIDPPFYSKVDYSLKERGDHSEDHAPSMKEQQVYSDKWEGGIQQYLEFLRNRIELFRGLLRQDGSLWVHLDYHVSHYAKTMLDQIFGYSNFINEIIWKRTNSPKVQSRGFGSQHDVLLLYALDNTKFRTNPILRAHDMRTLKPYSYKDEKGRFRLIEIEAQGIQRSANRKQFEWRGRTAPYLYSTDKLDQWWDQGMIYTSRNGRYTKKQYLSSTPGVPISDLWLDIPPVQGISNEYTGFITQKPIALLERVVEAGSDPGDIIADFFGGSGTSAVAADNLRRRWILADESEVAVGLMKQRLDEASQQYRVIRV